VKEFYQIQDFPYCLQVCISVFVVLSQESDMKEKNASQQGGK
jgi:hypothetical protein